ncbi:uncharacterized protein [Miscanthus floridulus]|uniref:uncharacterized protein n=1 Tax=Miscanthus floridulus TaxID=154761 RepID=UPI003457F27B
MVSGFAVGGRIHQKCIRIKHAPAGGPSFGTGGRPQLRHRLAGGMEPPRRGSVGEVSSGGGSDGLDPGGGGSLDLTAGSMAAAPPLPFFFSRSAGDCDGGGGGRCTLGVDGGGGGAGGAGVDGGVPFYFIF